jgi:4-hydroxybenzoate polyprenyltransferase
MLAAGSWTISSQTSGSWCTSNAQPSRPWQRAAAVVRLTHPFPSALNALATTAIALIAGGAPEVALRLGASMLALQTSIGALNDAIDAPIDSGRKQGKPIPRGLATSGGAMVLAGFGLVAGLALSAPSGGATVLVAIAGVTCGYAYDLGLGRTALSWLPLVVALPLLPVHAWLGATGGLPPGLAALIPAAVLAGAALAIGNGLVDVERDLAGRRPTVVVRLGARRAWWALVGLTVGLAAIALVAAPRVASGGFGWVELGLAFGFGILGLGVAVLRHGNPAVRERGWELTAVGVAGLGVSWLAGAASSAG